jgi:hypothetical protein
MQLRNLRRHLYLAPIFVAALVAALIAFAGSPDDDAQHSSAAPVAGMSIPF